MRNKFEPDIILIHSYLINKLKLFVLVMGLKFDWQFVWKYIILGIVSSIFIQDGLLAQPKVSPQAFSIPNLELPQFNTADDLSLPEFSQDLLKGLPISETNFELPQNPVKDFQIPSENTQHKAETLQGIKDQKYWIEFCDQAVISNEPGTALAACDRAIALQPKNINLWLHRTKILLYLQQYTKAIAASNYILELKSKHSLAFTYLSAALIALGEYQEAIYTSEEALRIDRRWSDASPALAWYYRGLALAGLQDYDLALDAYDQAL